MTEIPIPADLLAALADQVADAVVERLPNRPEPYLDAKAAAVYLSCPVSRIYELVEQRRLRHLRDGRRLLFRRSDLDAALREIEPC